MKKEFLVGIFVVVGIIGFALTIFLIKDIRVESGYRLNIYFDDVGNLMEKAWVRVRGVKVGKVERIILEDNKAKVVVWMKSFAKVHSDAKAKISSTGVLGVKYIELTLGSPDKPLLKDGDTIYFAEGAFSIDDALSDGISGIKEFSKFLQNMSKDGGMSKNLGEIVSNIKEFTGKLNRSVEEERLRNAVRYLETAGKDIKEILEPNKGNITNAILSLKNVSQKIDQLSENIVSTETVLGQIVSDKTSGAKIAQTFDSLQLVAQQANRVLNRINFFKTYWDYRMRYDTKNSEYKSDIGVNIYPKETKFYYISVNNVSSDQQSQGYVENNNTFSLGIGGSFYDKLVLYGGLIRSSGGFGIKLFPFGYKPKLLEFGTEVYNFSKTKDYPNIDISLRLKLTKWLYIGSRYEDVQYSKALNASLNISFEDEDVAYLFGLIGLSR
jgi:phospholipid/cholesterol/gamma-HCH transport system substrate-binding protein